MKMDRFVVLVSLALMVVSIANSAYAQSGSALKNPKYNLIDLGTFGGPQSYMYIPNQYARALTNGGTAIGWADTSTADPFPSFCFNPDCFVSHAFQTKNGSITDLGVLPGGANSAATSISFNGLIAGFSQNGQTDPTIPGFPLAHGVIWRNGVITDLSTLVGGYESVAIAVNNRGQAVGAADNGISDPNAIFSDFYGWLTQTRAFLWQNGAMQDLGTLGGTDAVALFVNDSGQVVGASYTDSNPSSYCVQLGFSLTTAGFLWENGKMKNLGGFGGSCTFPTDLNNRGDVVGISTTNQDQFQNAFLWSRGSLSALPNQSGGNNAAAIALNNRGDAVGWASLVGNQEIHASLWNNRIPIDLGTVGSDPCSIGTSLNAADQVVGISFPCDFSESRAFLWQNGSIFDMNSLIPLGSSLYLVAPETINDRGEITGVGVDSDGNQHAFLLVPCSDTDGACENALVGPAFTPPPKSKSGNIQNHGIRRLPGGQLEHLPRVLVPRLSSFPTANSEGASIADRQATQNSAFSPNWLDSLDTTRIHPLAPSACLLPGRQCSPTSPPLCCGGAKCLYHGGSTRTGYV